MSVITIFEVKTANDLKNFIKFPMELYKSNENYVPPLIKDEEHIWSPKENAALNFSEFKRYLALKDQKIVGRIAVMINHKEVEDLGISKVRFGWLDFIDDIEVTKALLNKAIEFAQQKEMTKIEGPMGFTNLDKAGMLTMGFDRLATMIGLYNHSYYPEHLEKLGLKKEKEWVEYELDFPEILSDKILKFSSLISEKYKLRVLEFNNKQEILPYVFPMFKLLDETYKTLSTYTPITDEQIQTYKDKYFNFIDKDYIVCIVDEHDELVSFAITMPSYSKALQKANGKLLPFGWYHLIQAGKKNLRANFYLIGIHPDYQRRGVTSLIFKEIWRNFSKKGIKLLETNPELEENKSVQVLWQDYNPVNHKRRRTYAMDVSPQTPLFS
ncbi:GNAT family N-acetyltransferase [Kaistella polysaccharea]|uniref:GNAT family N-acetyltransferase n=1 Tax=Kaistella polysaccharea TaxID=2878534 RepID=UPI001CF23719|nr:GNAT family N-acetyltransferase [Kaistella polysaccharea]